MMLSMAPAKVTRLRGKPETFDEAENAAIRDALRGYVQRNKLTGEELGRKLDVSQQTAGGYVNGTGGFSWPAARSIAWLLGFEGVDELLKEYHAFKGPKGQANTNAGTGDERDDARRFARRLGVSEEAMSRVDARLGDQHHIVRWWVDRYSQEQTSIDEERLRAAETKASKAARKKSG